MIQIGLRTIKTALGAGLALWISTLLELEYAMFSAIILIMCIERTKMKTLLTIKEKFLASLLGLIISAIFFEVLNYHPVVLTLFIIVFIPILVRLGIQAGFVTSMVVVLHVYMFKDFTMHVFLNELSIIGVGMGIALLVNSMMPNLKEDIIAYKREIEAKFTVIFREFANSLRTPNHLWDGQEIYEVERLINKGKSIAIQHVENHLRRKENDDYYYLEMRENQLKLLKQMLKIVAVISMSELYVKQREMLADFFEHTSERVHSGDTTEQSMRHLDEIMAIIRRMDLPKNREEFEVRANLYYLVFEMENYFMIKKRLFDEKWKEKGKTL